jgi:hypothetical protein
MGFGSFKRPLVKLGAIFMEARLTRATILNIIFTLGWNKYLIIHDFIERMYIFSTIPGCYIKALGSLLVGLRGVLSRRFGQSPRIPMAYRSETGALFGENRPGFRGGKTVGFFPKSGGGPPGPHRGPGGGPAGWGFYLARFGRARLF